MTQSNDLPSLLRGGSNKQKITGCCCEMISGGLLADLRHDDKKVEK